MLGDTDRSDGFPPIARADARVLVLGSLPGVRSLQDREYYAHPRNAFWSIMAVLAGASGSYEQRCEVLRDKGVALWDVLASSVRPGSLDANIDLGTATPNNFEAFLEQHTAIERICFNGQTAARIFMQRVPLMNDYALLTLPSTSPAHAAMSYDEKLDRWRRGINL